MNLNSRVDNTSSSTIPLSSFWFRTPPIQGTQNTIFSLIFSKLDVKSCVKCSLISRQWKAWSIKFGEKIIKDAAWKVGYIDKETKEKLGNKFDKNDNRLNRVKFGVCSVDEIVCSVFHQELNKRIAKLRCIIKVGEAFSTPGLPIEFTKTFFDLINYDTKDTKEYLEKLLKKSACASTMLSRIGLQEKRTIVSELKHVDVNDEKGIQMMKELIEECIIQNDVKNIFVVYDFLICGLANNSLNLFDRKYRVFFDLAEEILEMLLKQMEVKSALAFFEMFSNHPNQNQDDNKHLESLVHVGVLNLNLRKQDNKEDLDALSQKLLQHYKMSSEHIFWQALCNKNLTDDFIFRLVNEKIDSISDINTFRGWMDFRSLHIVDILMKKFASKEEITTKVNRDVVKFLSDRDNRFVDVKKLILDKWLISIDSYNMSRALGSDFRLDDGSNPLHVRTGPLDDGIIEILINKLDLNNLNDKDKMYESLRKQFESRSKNLQIALKRQFDKTRQ